MSTAANVVVGAPATILIGAYGAVEGASVDVGATEGGVQVNWNPEHYFKTADQWLAPVGAVKTVEGITVVFNVAEATLANIVAAFGYPVGAVAGQVLDVGGDSTVTERTVYINSNAPDGGNRKITVHKCVITDTTAVSMVKADKTMIQVTLTVLQDTSKAANQQMINITDTGGDTTPPTVAMTAPVEDGNVTAASSDTLTLTFTEAGSAIDEGTLIYGDADNATIMVVNVEDPAATVLKAGTISYNAGTKVLTFTPTAVWEAATENFQIIITTGVRDTAGNNLASVFFGHFVTA